MGKETKHPKKKKVVLPIIGVIILVLLVIGFIGYSYIFGSATTKAFLYIDEGKVEVNQGSGWTAAVDEMQLSINDAVRTLNDGRASIVFFESDVMELEPNTEVSLKEVVSDNIALEQKSGSTWNRVSKLTGSRAYSVETPTSVATVRGTGYGVSITEEGDEIIVEDGLVDCSSKTMEGTESIGEYEMCTVDKGERALKGKLTKEQMVMMKRKLQKDVYNLQRLRWREAMKHRAIITTLKEKYGVTNDEIKQFLDEVDHGKRDVDELESKLPFKGESMVKMKALTEKVVNLNGRMDKLDQLMASHE